MLVVVQEYENLPPRRRHVLGADGELEVGLAPAAAPDLSAPQCGDAGRGRRRPDGLAVRPESLLACCWRESPGSLTSAEGGEKRIYFCNARFSPGRVATCQLAVGLLFYSIAAVAAYQPLASWMEQRQDEEAMFTQSY